MKEIYFIVKPLSNRKYFRFKKALEIHSNTNNFDFFILKSEKKGHAIELTKNAITKKADIVVACGGDGTVNEVASVLIKTEIPLGIVPIGSGNGIARHFKMPFKFSKAIELILIGNYTRMDVGLFDQKYFLGNLGFGFEATFIENYQKNGLRGLLAYILAFVNACFNFKYPKIKLEWDQKSITVSPFVLLISNLNQQGYNLTLTPYARSNDGKLNMIYMEKSNFFQIFKFIFKVLFNKIKRSKKIHSEIFSKMKITNLKGNLISYEIDGEFFKTDKHSLEVSVFSGLLKIISPK